jgi:hypothetical protein
MNDMKHAKLPEDPDLRGSLPALRRAAIHARELAERTGTPCWIMRDGRIVDAISGREAVLPRQPDERPATGK